MQADNGRPGKGRAQVCVGNTGYVRSMYQMICPALEDFQAMEGLDASGTGAFEEVYGRPVAVC